MDAETLKVVVPAAATALVAGFGYLAQRLTSERARLREKLAKRERELMKAYAQVSGYYQLEHDYSTELADKTGEAARTVKTRFRNQVQARGFARPEWTSAECSQAVERL